MSRTFQPAPPGLTLKETLPAPGPEHCRGSAAAGRELHSAVALSRPRRHFLPETWPAGWKPGRSAAGRAELWLRQQIAYDLWQSAQRPRPQVIPARRWWGQLFVAVLLLAAPTRWFVKDTEMPGYLAYSRLPMRQLCFWCRCRLSKMT